MLASPSLRLVPRAPGALGPHLARLGARAFAVRAGDDVLLTLPDVVGPTCVLVPRGQGWPMLARRVAGALRALPAGEPCSPARWAVAGGLAATVRRVALPRGPALAEPGPTPAAGPRDGWLCLRPSELGWAAARRANPALGTGPAALVDRWVRAVSPEAAARGVTRGMSLALARRRCPGLQAHPPVSGVALGLELGEWLEATFGGARRVPGGWLVPWAGGPGGLDDAAALVRRVWQRFGVVARAALADGEAAARGLAAVLPPGFAGAATPAATRAWAARRRAGAWAAGARRASWRGPAIVDVEGALELARALAADCGAGAGALEVRVDTERGTRRVVVPLPREAGRATAASLVEAHLRAPLAVAGAVGAVRVRARARSVAGGRGLVRAVGGR